MTLAEQEALLTIVQHLQEQVNALLAFCETQIFINASIGEAIIEDDTTPFQVH